MTDEAVQKGNLGCSERKSDWVGRDRVALSEALLQRRKWTRRVCVSVAGMEAARERTGRSRKFGIVIVSSCLEEML